MKVLASVFMSIPTILLNSSKVLFKVWLQNGITFWELAVTLKRRTSARRGEKATPPLYTCRQLMGWCFPCPVETLLTGSWRASERESRINKQLGGSQWVIIQRANVLDYYSDNMSQWRGTIGWCSHLNVFKHLLWAGTVISDNLKMKLTVLLSR